MNLMASRSFFKSWWTSACKDMFDDFFELKPMIGPKYEIKMKDETIKPQHLNVPRKTPFALRDGAKA